jgi:hypothetical protein
MKSHKYRHPNSLRKKKQWEALSAAGKCTLRRLGIQRHHSPGYVVKCTKINSKIKAKALQRFKQRTNRIRWGRAVNSILLQHDDGRPHPSAINAAAIRNVGIDVIPHLPFKTVCDIVWLPDVCISQEASQRISFWSCFVSINCKLFMCTHKHLHITVLSSYFLNYLVYKALQEHETLYFASTNVCPKTNFLNVRTNIYIYPMVVHCYFVP